VNDDEAILIQSPSICRTENVARDVHDPAAIPLELNYDRIPGALMHRTIAWLRESESFSFHCCLPFWGRLCRSDDPRLQRTSSRILGEILKWAKQTGPFGDRYGENPGGLTLDSRCSPTPHLEHPGGD
jgi:hypothetical protein